MSVMRAPKSLRTLKIRTEAAAVAILAIGPANEIQRPPFRGFRRLRGLYGTGLAHPNTGCLKMMRRRGKMIVPNRSMWTRGLRDARPRAAAVGSPSRLAVQAWAASWTVMAKKMANAWTSIRRISMV